MYCTKCGEKVNKNAKFCTACGAKIVEINKEKEVTNVDTTNTNAKPVNNGAKTASIVLGVISILTCFTCFIPITLGIVGLILAIQVRKNDKKFVTGIVLNIIGLIGALLFVILSIVGIVYLGFSVEGKLTHEWCCSTSNSNEKCEINLELDDNYKYSMEDSYEIFESNGTWDYEWIDDTKLKGDQYDLTLDQYDYTVYIKDGKMKMYSKADMDTPIMYCVQK